jgi:pumilio RNA-binding family
MIITCVYVLLSRMLICCVRFGNWAVQRYLEAASVAEERRKIVSCMRFVNVVTLSSVVADCFHLKVVLSNS